MSQYWLDVRHAVRVLIKSPVVTIVAMASLAFGIGANTAIFSIINALILKSLPVHDPQRLVAISTISPDNGDNDPLSLPMFAEIGKRQHVFSSMLAFSGGGMNNFEVNGVKWAGGLDTVSGHYFSTLGIRPLVGRLIEPNDVGLQTGSSAQVAVLDYRCWLFRYHGDLAVLGRTIRVNGIPLTIVGVTPKSFSGLVLDSASDVTVPIGYAGDQSFRDPRMLWLDVIGRLRPDVTLQQARAQIKAVLPQVQAATLPTGYAGAQRARFFARRIDLETAAKGTSYLLRSSPEVIMPATARVKETPSETLPVEERIRRRAYELYVLRGNQSGSDLDDWLQAEEEIRRATEQAIDEASEESFPASDPPAY